MAVNPELLEKLSKVKKGTVKMKIPGTKARIRKDIQEKVDAYLELDAQLKAIEKQLKQLRNEIEPYMDEHGLKRIDGTNGGYIELVETNRAIVTSRYTSYNLDGVLSLLDEEAKKQCIVKVVDKDVLELLVKTGRAPKEVYQHKVYNPGRNFTPRHV
jgi:uncharacterized protein YhaN